MDMAKTHRYDVNGYLVEMTKAQARRWNAGTLTVHDEANIRVTAMGHDPDRHRLERGEVVTTLGLPNDITRTLRNAPIDWELDESAELID